VALTPESIANPNLPRTKVGGYSIEATDGFLKEVAWEWRRLQSDRRKLSEQNAELERRLDEIHRKIEELRGEPIVRSERQPLSAAALAAAYRAAEAVREEARRESETVLKKARKRAEHLDDEVERARIATTERIRELEETQMQARARLSAFLTEMLVAVETRAEESAGPRLEEAAEPPVDEAPKNVLRELPLRAVASSEDMSSAEADR
jgi:cell division septum initiation protein DivIVA